VDHILRYGIRNPHTGKLMRTDAAVARRHGPHLQKLINLTYQHAKAQAQANKDQKAETVDAALTLAQTDDETIRQITRSIKFEIKEDANSYRRLLVRSSGLRSDAQRIKTFGSTRDAQKALAGIDIRKRQEHLLQLGLKETSRRVGEAYEATQAVLASDPSDMRAVNLATRRLQTQLGQAAQNDVLEHLGNAVGIREQKVDPSEVTDPTQAFQLFAKAAGIPTEIDAVSVTALQRIEDMGSGKIPLSRDMPASPTPEDVQAFTRERILLHLAMGTVSSARDFVDKVKAEGLRRGVRTVFPQGPVAPTSAERKAIHEDRHVQAFAERVRAAEQEERRAAEQLKEAAARGIPTPSAVGTNDGSSRYREELRREQQRLRFLLDRAGDHVRAMDFRSGTDAFRQPIAGRGLENMGGIYDDFGSREERYLHAELLRLG